MKSHNLIRSLSLSLCFAAGAALTTESYSQTTFQFSKTRPRLVVLMHGVTPRPIDDPEIGIGKSRHARYYWGFDFIKAAQGRSDETQMRVITPRTDKTLRFATNAAEDWHHLKVPENSAELAPICYPVSWFTNLPAGIETNQTLIKDYIRLMTKNGADSTMVMVANRDGSKHFGTQLGQAVDNIYDSYKAAFSHLDVKYQPQIYLVGHSFGGIIARGIIANPTGADLFGNKLTFTQKIKAEFIRNRTVLINTMSTPHHGTPIPTVATDASNYIATTGFGVITAIYNAMSFLPWKWRSEAWVRGMAKSTTEDILKAISGKRDCLADLNRMEEYNTGILNPNTMKRADGTLVPIYTYAGRNPGSRFYDQSRSVFALGGGVWNPVSTLDFAMGYGRWEKEAMALNIIETLMRTEGYGKQAKRPWGTATFPDGDRVSSPHANQGNALRAKGSPLLLTNGDIKYMANAFLAGKPYVQNASDGEWDNDGFLGFDSGHALGLTGMNWFRVYNKFKYGNTMPWDFDNHGSMMFNPGSGAWLHNELIRDAGPYVYSTNKRLSVWTNADTMPIPYRGLKLELLQLHDLDNNLDTFTAADFSVRVKIGQLDQTHKCANNVRTVTNIPAFTISNYNSTVIPIQVSVVERDADQPPYDPDDLCALSPKYPQTSLFLYFDTRTGRITGDMNGAAGQILTARPWTSAVSNRAQLKFRITRTQ